ncbi:uncharacterized protein LOC106668171 isoform X1 [Cimex lectularius]|uniref:Fibronectin type-III domain-containing protein n=1 Tax=Cimex lectularius TaxID=79782 RepID=A0A8I6RVL0_CIMLE|nr:uncharacterized protein LOC106668171 isoform X1 [Cimex lectularius]
MRTYEEMPAILILVCVLFIHSGITEEEIGSPLRVAQCRARCIQRFTTHGNSEKGCPQGSDCSMCWENCQLLQSNFPVWWSTICDEKRICFPGCEEACQFHAEIGGGQSEPVVRTRSEEVLKVENSVASWSRPNKASGPFVYVVMRRVGDRPWKQITQTLEPRAWVPEGGVLRVLVVNRVGLVAIYSPEQPDSEMAQMKAVLESLGRGGVLNGYPIPPPPPQGKRINTQIVQPSTSIPNNNILDDSRAEGKRPWNLHTISLIHQKYLVIAEIAWEGRRQLQGSRKPIYFVTWEVDGGGLKGNLLTESTTVTLSLCTDTVYHIEVQVAVREGDAPGERSEELVVDTGLAIKVELDSGRWADAPRRVPADRRTHELALGAGAAFALFLIVALVVFIRTRRSRTPKLLPYQSQSISRVFPPMVHVVEEDNHHMPVAGLPRGTLHV